MSSDSDIIELNGKRYDSRTGHLLSVPGIKAKPSSKKIHVRDASAAPVKVHHRTEKAKTLMRQAVKKPTPAKHKITPKAAPVVHRKPTSRLHVDPDRAARASQTQKSHMIKRFGSQNAESNIRLITTELPVQPEPIPVSTPPVEERMSTRAHTYARSTTDTHDAWQQAIDRATSHTQPRSKKTTHRQRTFQNFGVSNRVLNLSAGTLAAVLLIGFTVYLNLPHISMRVASTRSGVIANMPGYQPAGFGLEGPITYGAGYVTLDFKSHSDNRQFEIHQRNSDWDDVTLVKDYLTPDYNSFQTNRIEDKTVYIYGGHNATWIDNGVWYEVKGDSSLSNDQLLRLAASM